MLEAAIFDMDGLLVDSEPLWRRAEQQVFPRVGLHLTDDMCRQTTGVRLDEVVRYWYGRQPWTGPSVEQIAEEITTAVCDLVASAAQPMPGVEGVLAFFRQRRFRIALASSSSSRLIQVVLERFGLAPMFDVVQSAENLPYGKPHPGVFLAAATQLGVEPTRCLVFEDSFTGLIAAKAARMRTVVVPAPAEFHQTRYDIADLKLGWLGEFGQEHLDRLRDHH
jgi:sugar-phosphatase